MKYVTSPILNDVRGFNLGQLITVKNAAMYARMTKRKLIIPYIQATNYPLAEQIRKTLTKNEETCAEFINLRTDSAIKGELIKIAQRLFSTSGTIAILPPPSTWNARVIYGKQFEKSLVEAINTPQRLNIVKDVDQTGIPLNELGHITQEFANVSLPVIFGAIDTLVCGANAIGAWPTKVLKFKYIESRKSDYQFFIHPVLRMDGEKLGIWRKTVGIEDIQMPYESSRSNKPFFYTLIALYYTTKSKGMEIKLTPGDVVQIWKIYERITNICKWIEQNFDFYFTVGFFDGSRNLDLTDWSVFDFKRVINHTMETSKLINEYKKGQISRAVLSVALGDFGTMCSLLDLQIPAARAHAYTTGSEVLHPSMGSISTDIDVILVPGKNNDPVKFIEPTKNLKLDLKVFNETDLGLGFNHKFATMLLDSTIDEMEKNYLIQRVNQLTGASSTIYLLDGLFENYLFEKIFELETSKLTNRNLPTDLIKKGLGMQRTMDSLRWYWLFSTGENLLQTRLMEDYAFFVNAKRVHAENLCLGDLATLRRRGATVINSLEDVIAEKNSDARGYVSFLKLMQQGLAKEKFEEFRSALITQFKLEPLDDLVRMNLEIKLAPDVETALIIFREFNERPFALTPFIRNESLKSILQRLRIQLLDLGGDYEADAIITSEDLHLLQGINSIYVTAAIKHKLQQEISGDTRRFYWNNLTHVSDLYLRET